ncbi:lipopolysaccharide assembly protein LapB [Nitrosomonas sp. Nm166]|uniref:tetratricopeptide repeat protein n=1 Tax=Nitrosomonas sp. Nm166 TaxID=1881054 RepID=UPI0008E79D9F|nr:CDC27 family protein [Nitrosomonas sp. Nm166]SFE18984.1 Tetratricopeptide repeat-containing protein [Nitrosomonas sp. Nm166]
MTNPIDRLIQCSIAAIVLGFYSHHLPAAENKAQPTDFIELAAVMLKDGHHDRALLALQSVDLENKKTDLARFYTLQGLAYMGLNDLEAAKGSLQQAVKNGQKDPAIFIYLAQTYFGLKDYKQTIDAIGKAGSLVNKDAALISLKAESYWHLKQTEAAINALNDGQRAFPADLRFLKRKVFYFVELGLYQEAVRLGREYLQRSKASAADYVAFGNALRLSKEYQEALNILEIARLQFPQDEMVAKLLAHTYLDQGKLNSAAFILEQAALLNPSLQAEAAEIYRRAGRLHKALTLNESISDQKIKLKQRLSILLALKQFERAANMESGLYRNGLLEDQDVRYALAYALFSNRRFAEANKHLDHLKNAELFRKGTELRRLMEVCKAEPWQCT